MNQGSMMQITRRQFLSTAAAMATTVAAPRVLFSQAEDTALEARLAADPERPQYHLLPAHNWMNDPNGPIYFNGRYHMFFQYDPLAATWGDMSWNHAVSQDMLHWTHLPLALTPTPNSQDSFGVFSGSAIAVPHGSGKRVYAVYTGTQKSDDAHATIRDGANNIQESQCLAWSDDPQLIHWTKDSTPVIPAPPAGLKYTGFRDPSAWQQGDSYYMTVGSGEENVGGCVLLYRSKDLRQWEYLHKLTSGQWNGHKTPNPCDDGEMWECPELFPLPGSSICTHALIFSTMGRVIWQSGVLDPETMLFTMKKSGALDLGAFYAPKTQLDAHGRRILWGWIQERRSDAAMTAAGWSGMMSLPRVLALDPAGNLRIRIVPETAVLRGNSLPVAGISGGITCTLPAANGELLVTGSKDKDFKLRLGENGELATVEYSAAAHSMRIGGKEIALQPTDVPTIHGFIDGSVIELILAQRIGCTKRFYYQGAAPGVAAFVESSDPALKLAVWSVKPISPNRLTTPA